MEIKCQNERCELDMWENHYTYEIAEDHSVDDLCCPLCGTTEQLEEINVESELRVLWYFTDDMF